MEKNFKNGQDVWLDCEVSPGPLSEYLVRLKVGPIKWFGFVKESELSKDRKKVRGVILDLKNGIVTIGIRGHSPTSNNAFQASKDAITGVGAFA